MQAIHHQRTSQVIAAAWRTPAAVNYSWRQLAYRAGITDMQERQGTGFEKLGLRLHYGLPGEFGCQDSAAIIVVPCREESWDLSSAGAVKTIQWIPIRDTLPRGERLPIMEKVPVLFWGGGFENGGKPFVERREDGAIVFYADILAAVFFMLSRWEETSISVRDAHGRFPAAESFAWKQKFLDRPVVDEYAVILQSWIKTILPGWQPIKREYSVKLSHDIDHVRRFPSFYKGGLSLAADILKRRDVSRALHTMRIMKNLRDDPLYNGIFQLADWSEENGLISAFYFMGAVCKKSGAGYDPCETFIENCIKMLLERGHEIGFHPGYHTQNDPIRFRREKKQLERAAGKGQMGGRQHFLRFRIPETWRLWEQEGLSYDSTLGYAEHEGFRCGTCHPFRPFDMEQQRELEITEIPLIVMDATLKQYRALTPDEGRDRILFLAGRCRAVGGVFTLLWHNSSLQDDWKPWAAMCREILPLLAAMRG
ncbi:MAG: polysaccharide deacetylase family protein [Thermodesulfobacteriota bacterium]